MVQPDEPPLMSDADRRTELEAKLHANWSRGFHEEKDHTYFGKLLDTHVSLEKRVEEQLLIDQFDRRDLFSQRTRIRDNLFYGSTAKDRSFLSLGRLEKYSQENSISSTALYQKLLRALNRGRIEVRRW